MTERARFMHVLLEGQTESLLMERLFQPHWEETGWLVTSSVIVTGRYDGVVVGRGGVSRWAKLEKEIRRVLRGEHFDVVTTIIDYYGFPSGAPGMADRPNGATPRQQVEHVEAALVSRCGDRRFLPHLTLHESETWVFAASAQLAELAGDEALHERLQLAGARAGGPEGVNGEQDTAPSKRLAKLWPDYRKPSDGPLAIVALGLPGLRRQCPHLDAWLSAIEAKGG